MEIDIKEYVDSLFKDKLETRNTKDLKEEMTCNLQEMYRDLLKQGTSPEKAFEKIRNEVGDVGAVLKNAYTIEPFSKLSIVAEKFFLFMCLISQISILIISLTVFNSEMFPNNKLTEKVVFAIYLVSSFINMYEIISVIKTPQTKLVMLKNLKVLKIYSQETYRKYRCSIYLCWGIILVLYIALSIISKEFGNTTILFGVGFIIHKLIRLQFNLGREKLEEDV